MQAVILAGGEGTRLRPLTINFPKPLLPVGDQPILEVIIRQLAHAGFEEIIISTGYLAELIETYFGDGARWGVSIRYVHEKSALNTAGSLKIIDDLAPCFLVMNGDVLTDLDYGSLLKEHESRTCEATIATIEHENKIDFGVIESTPSGVLEGIREKPVYSYSVSMGVYVLNRSAIEQIANDEAIGMPDFLLRVKESGGQVHCHPFNGHWLDIGRLDDYERANLEFLSKKDIFLPEEELFKHSLSDE